MTSLISKSQVTNILKYYIENTLYKFNLDLCNIIIEYLILQCKDKTFISEWDLYTSLLQGYSGFYSRDENKLHKKRIVEQNSLYWYSYGCGWEELATDCSESEEISIHELSDTENVKFHKRYRFDCKWDSRETFEKNETKIISKLELFNNITTNQYLNKEECVFNNQYKLFQDLFKHPHIYDYNYTEDEDDADIEDNE